MSSYTSLKVLDHNPLAFAEVRSLPTSGQHPCREHAGSNFARLGESLKPLLLSGGKQKTVNILILAVAIANMFAIAIVSLTSLQSSIQRPSQLYGL